MANKYNPQEVEEKIRKFWDKGKIFKFDPKRKGDVYSIDTPPPTVSGKMHIGHAFSYSQQDFIARFQRMKGNVFYPFGTDDNGLPTERLIEKLKNVKSKKMSRADFIKLCLKTLKEITPEFIQDWKNLGISADYDIYYSTIDENSRKISQKSFIELFKKGIVYQKEFPTIWCPECQTSIAQAELEDKDSESVFSTLKFSVDSKDLLIATTRPELLPACVLVFVNPKDKRYKSLIGKKAKVPLFEHEVPIIADESAEIDKGTGVLMVCSYGDKYDAEAINKHNIEPKLILEKDGTLNFGNYKGMKIKEARKKILEDLDKKGLIKEQKKINHVVNVHDKCGGNIEFITTEQWFIKVLDKKKKLIEQGKNIEWYPKFMFKRYENWVNGLEWDWSISRDRHFGIPIPVWYCEKCNEVILPEEKELPIDPLATKKNCKCGGKGIPEEKVLDTWATSSLTPQIASSVSGNKVKIPFSLRPQAHDIIRTWAFYTIVKSLYHEDKLPWKNVMVSGFVTLKGEKMSKSKGNVIDPKKVLEEYGSDVLRFAAAGSKLGNDADYQEQDLIAGKKFITKLWNATKFVFMNLEDFKGNKPSKLEQIDELFLERLQKLVNEVTVYFENYEYSKARDSLEKFFWHDFADNYIEIVKTRVYQNKKGKESAQYVLYKSLLAILKLIAPITPFITEEIYQTYFKKTEKDKSIHISEWPKSDGGENKPDESLNLFYEILGKIRQEKTNAKKAMNSEISITLSKEDYKGIEKMLEDLKDVMNIKEIKTGRFKVEFIQ
jgi:valyl-tRNA synthetase